MLVVDSNCNFDEAARVLMFHRVQLQDLSNTHCT